ncbi:uncharacterized protein LOC119676051 [Teleopsis dalmanni]|uniref:uncharacterized protein LOC119676051 n=1 Tax=Teleopsis dalmanni TaxID=139649 RepID=UPI0018CE0266|nr:uncharacterized protein LOC119676051 [Teleopsis dalmanni]
MCLAHSAVGLYIKPTVNKNAAKQPEIKTENEDTDEWKSIQQMLGLPQDKVDLLKSHDDQPAIKDLVKRYINENSKYITIPNTKSRTQVTNSFDDFYKSLLNQLKKSKRTLKTSLRFELADKPKKELKRSPRKIAVKMVSDMPTNEIDQLLKIFNKRHGIDSDIDSSAESNDQDDYMDYKDHALPLSSGKDSDYMYENLYEDQGDLGVPAKTHHNTEFGSFQDLIMQAARNQWQRDVEESKLHQETNKHFI